MSYSLPDPHSYYAIVWEIVRQIPSGRVASYGQIAAMIPAPEGIDAEDYRRLGARWVGDAMNAISGVDEVDIPWHRVINSRGSISLPPESAAAAIQRGRLRHEGVAFDATDQTKLDTFGWEGPAPEWLAERGLLAPPSRKKPPAEGPQQLSLF
jgi:methylated-DNA-protein-cysteine methyltransferase-like protein